MSEHPKDRAAEPADPFQLFADGVAGDPGLMFDCLVEEYARMGYGEIEIVALFENPSFLATHGLRDFFGPDRTRGRVREVLSRCGTLRVRAIVAPPETHSLCQGSQRDA